MISQLIASIVFVSVAFYGVFVTGVLFEIFITTYFLKWIVAVADTPFVYWGRLIFKRDRFVFRQEL